MRRALSSELRAKIDLNHEVDSHDDVSLAGWTPEKFAKSDAEYARIRQAVKGNAFFEHLTSTQHEQIYDAMRRKEVKQGEVVIRQVRF